MFKSHWDLGDVSHPCDPRKSELIQELHTSRKTRVFTGRCLPRYNLWQVGLKPTGCQTPHNLQGLWPSLLGATGYSLRPLTRQSSASVQCRQLRSHRCVQGPGQAGPPLQALFSSYVLPPPGCTNRRLGGVKIKHPAMTVQQAGASSLGWFAGPVTSALPCTCSQMGNRQMC